MGLAVLTLADVYGEQGAQEAADETWIAYAAANDLVVLTKDDRIRRRPAERLALTDGGVRAFCLTNGQITFNEQTAWIVDNIHRIMQASSKPGPFLYGVYADRIERLWPK